jgi:hypothetical protein
MFLASLAAATLAAATASGPATASPQQQSQTLPLPLIVHGRLIDTDAQPYSGFARVTIKQVVEVTDQSATILHTSREVQSASDGSFTADFGEQVFSKQTPILCFLQPAIPTDEGYSLIDAAGPSASVKRGVWRRKAATKITGTQTNEHEVILGRTTFADAPLVCNVTLADSNVTSMDIYVGRCPDGDRLEPPFPSGESPTLVSNVLTPLYSWAEGTEFSISSTVQGGRFIPHERFAKGQTITISTRLTTRLDVTVDMTAQPQAYRWGIHSATGYTPFTARTTSNDEWRFDVAYRTLGRGHLASTSEKRLYNYQPGNYKIELWSKQPTANGQPLAVYDVTITNAITDVTLD